MIQGKLVKINEEDQILEIRKRVIQEETGILIDQVEDQNDEEGYHAIVLENISSNRIVGTGRIYKENSNVIIDEIAVLTNYRGKGYGDFITRMLLNKGLSIECDQILVGAQKKHLPFYEKIGLVSYNNFYLEKGIIMVNMYLPENKLKKPCENMINNK